MKREACQPQDAPAGRGFEGTLSLLVCRALVFLAICLGADDQLVACGSDDGRVFINDAVSASGYAWSLPTSTSSPQSLTHDGTKFYMPASPQPRA